MPGQPIVVLLAEDNTSHARLMTRQLEDHCVANRVFRVNDGQSALDYLNHRGEFSDPNVYPQPDLVILDLDLPKVTGLEVLTSIKANDKLKKASVVVLSTSQVEVSRARNLGADAYLVKPIDFAAFAGVIGDLGFYWLACRNAADKDE